MRRRRAPKPSPAEARVAPTAVKRTRPNRTAIALAIAILLAAIGFAVWMRAERGAQKIAAFPAAPPEQPGLAFEDFAGAGECAECHQTQYTAWRASTHGRAGGDPAEVELLRPFDGRPIRFSDATVMPRVTGGDFVFDIVREGRPTERMHVAGVVGGGHMVGGGTQGFVMRADDGTLRFLPFELARDENVWFCNTGTRLDSGWLPITSEMRLADCGDWPPTRVLGDQHRFATCQQCHGSQIEVAHETGRPFATRLASLAIDCESCHGPARAHIEAARTGADGDGLQMRSLATLGEQASNAVCFACHALKDGLRPGYLPGAELELYYSLLLPLLSDAPIYADGRTRTFAYQQGHLWSDCYLAGTLTCTDCHEPHGQTYRDVTGEPLGGRFDDRQCTGCHASKAIDVERHTRHAPASEGSRCVACHMPYLQQSEVGDALQYARSDHTIPVPRPASDAALGIEVACAQCHRDAGVETLAGQVRDGWGELKPRRPVVESLLSAGFSADRARLVEIVENDPGGHDAATFMVLGTLLRDHIAADSSLEDELESRLRQLARHEQPDIAAAALAALHIAEGEEPDSRRFMVARLDSLGAEQAQVRRRWVVLLAFLGDRYRQSGRHAEALTAYRKAMQLEPRDAGLLASLGLAHAQAGDHNSAIDAYRQSIAVDSMRALTWVNLGIALAAAGDPAGAESAQRTAISVNPTEPLASFNLGNIYLRSNRLQDAEAAYRTALQANPGLAPAWFNLARSLVAREDFQGAADAIRAGLEFDPANANAREFLEELERAGVAAGPDEIPAAR